MAGRMWRRLVGVLLAASLAACSGVPNGSPEAELFRRACARCHPVEVALAVRQDLEGWRRTIWGMRRKGARIDGAQAERLARYLARVRGRE